MSNATSFSRRGLFVSAAAGAISRGLAAPVSFPDKDLYPDGALSYTKALPHNALGAVEPAPFRALREALASRDSAAFERILLGSSVKLSNPQAAFAKEIEGPDPTSIPIAPPPLFSSDAQAGEIVELYWKALARDVHFSDYATDPVIRAACADLSTLPGFDGPKENGKVTTRTLFRGRSSGDLAGPYLSQFLLRHLQYGAFRLEQRLSSPRPGMDYATTFSRWLAIQNGEARVSDPHEPVPRYDLDPVARWTRNGRDLAEIVHRDFTYQTFLDAALVLLSLKAPLDRGNPYRKSGTQVGFCTFGEAHLLDLLARVVNSALKAAWYQKWVLYLRLRPEEYAGKIHLHLTGAVEYPLPAVLRRSAALERTRDAYGSYLLPQAYPEGCPTHPSYPAGHAVIAGACATVLKAYFDESFELRDPVAASADGSGCEPCGGPDLRVGGELNKLASNIAFGRNFAGIHWRSDGEQGMAVGEAVALAILGRVRATCSERPCSFTVTRFNGETVTV